MDWRTPPAVVARIIREGFSYYWRVFKRAAADTAEYLAKHYISWEVTLAVAGGIVLGFLESGSLLSRAGSGLLSGLGILIVAVVLHFLARLLATPVLIHRDIEEELAFHAPSVRDQSLCSRGLLDFQVDIYHNVSLGQLTEHTKRLGKEADRATKDMKKYQPSTGVDNPPRVRLRGARHIAKKMKASARRVRRIHAKMVVAQRDFEETWMGYTPIFFAYAPPQLKETLLTAMTGAKESVVQYRGKITETRGLFQGELRHMQREICEACVLSDEVYGNLEKTLGRNVEAIEQIIVLLKGGSLPQRTKNIGSKRKGSPRRRKP